MDAKEIGRWLLASDLEPFSEIGTIGALRHVEVELPWFKKAWNSRVIAGAISFAAS